MKLELTRVQIPKTYNDLVLSKGGEQWEYEMV